MNNKLRKIESTYWKIGKIAGVVVALLCYQIWTEPFNIIKAILLIAGVSVGIFIAINILDLTVGLMIGIIKSVHKTIKDRRLLRCTKAL